MKYGRCVGCGFDKNLCRKSEEHQGKEICVGCKDKEEKNELGR